jgi:hypothetical protein
LNEKYQNQNWKKSVWKTHKEKIEPIYDLGEVEKSDGDK